MISASFRWVCSSLRTRGGEVHPEDVREAMGLGAVKINIGTAISLAIREGARRALDEGLDHYGMLRAMREEVRQVARDKIELMGASVRSRQDATAGV